MGSRLAAGLGEVGSKKPGFFKKPGFSRAGHLGRFFGKGKPVSGSLSVVLPVLNAERTLAKNVEHVLEVLSDLGARFEVLIVDQGSTDQTADVAHDMAVTFPQIRVARPRSQLEDASGLEVDLEQTVGEFVFVHQGHRPFNVNDFRRLWEICRAANHNTSEAEMASVGSSQLRLASAEDVPTPNSIFLGINHELPGIHALRRRTTSDANADCLFP